MAETISLLSVREVSARTSLSRSEIYRRVRAGTFPPPVKLGVLRSAWASDEIAAWVSKQLGRTAA